MSRRRVSVSTRRRYPAGVAYSREFLERLARILVQSGHSPRKLASEFRDVCRGLKEPAHTWDPALLNYVADLPHVIAHWHSDPQYLDSRGLPLPIPLHARGPSLAALIARVLPRANPAEVLQSLLKQRTVRRQGQLYSPTDRYLSYHSRQTIALGLVHGLIALLGMLRTVEYNISSRRREKTLLESTAINPQVAVRALPDFHQRLKHMAAEFLWDADGNMRRHEVPAGSEPTTRLGVGVFAFEDPMVTGTRARTRRRNAQARAVRRARRRGKRP